MNSKREAISFGRFSSKPQEKGDSKHRQGQAYERILTRYSDKLTRSERFGFGVLFGEGESGFHGGHLAQGGSLRAFLDKLKSGEIDPRKSALCIDEWSRFSRIEPDLAVKLLSDIVRSGCPVVIHNPDMWVDEASISSPQFIIISFLLQQAHSASKEKSDWQTASWKGRRERADGLTKENVKSAVCPTWLSVEGNKYVENEKAPLLRQACELSTAGYGATEITRTLGNAFPGLLATLRSRTLIGEYRPAKREAGKKVKTGEVFEGFYPALLTVDQFNRLQASLDSRKFQKAKRGKFVTCLFSGLVFNADGVGMVIGTVHGRKILKPKTGKFRSLHYSVLETAMLDLFLDIAPEDLFPALHTADLATELRARIVDKQKQLTELKAKYLAGGSVALLDMITTVEKQIDNLQAELNGEEVKASVGRVDTLGATQDLVGHLAGLTGSDLLDARLRLKALIRTLVARIDVMIWASTKCGLVVTLANGKEVRVGETTKGGQMQVTLRAG